MTESDGNSSDVGMAVVMAALSILAIIFNGLGLLIVHYNPVLANIFGKLCFSRCLANMGACTIFLLWAAPLTIVQCSRLATSVLGKIVGQTFFFCWVLCVYCHLAIAINRFVAIAFPLKVIHFTTLWKTRLMISLPWIVALLHVIPFFWYSSCYFIYNPVLWSWKYSDTVCGLIQANYLDEYAGFVIFGFIAVLDMLTLFLLRQSNKVVSEMVFDYRKVPEDDQIVKRRRKIQWKFFLQSCIQGGIFCFELTSFYIFSQLNDNKYFVFFTSTFVSLMCRLLDGFVLICFHIKSYQRQRAASAISAQKPTFG